MSEQTINLGYCGKLPSRGDFVEQGLDKTFIDPWNEWLQAVIAVSKEQLGDSWVDRYLTSPIWHFAISPATCGQQAYFGTFIPSIDAVGRHFPMTVATPINARPIDIYLQNVTNEAYEDQVLIALDDSLDLGKWIKQVQDSLNIAPSEFETALFEKSADPHKTSTLFELGDHMSHADLMHAMLHQHYGQYCLWWTQGSCLIEPNLLVTPGLPAINQFAAMLDGRWQHWQWNAHQVLDQG